MKSKPAHGRGPGAERAEQVGDAVDVGAAIGAVVEAVRGGGVGDQLDAIRDRTERLRVAQVARERTDGSGKAVRMPAEPEHLVPVGGEQQPEGGPDVAAPGDEHASHASPAFVRRLR